MQNCMLYNADGSDFYALAELFSRRFEERFQKIMDEFGEDVICGNIGAPRYHPPPASASAAPAGKKSRSNSMSNSSGRATPVAQSSERSSLARKMAAASSSTSAASGIVPLDARTRFAARLQRLSGMELGHVLQVIDIQCPEALEDPTPESLRSDAPPVTKQHSYSWDKFDGGCQIEIDVDAIPPVTFYELDKYVKENVQGRGKGAWGDDIAEDADVEGIKGKRQRKMKSF